MMSGGYCGVHEKYAKIIRDNGSIRKKWKELWMFLSVPVAKSYSCEAGEKFRKDDIYHTTDDMLRKYYDAFADRY